MPVFEVFLGFKSCRLGWRVSISWDNYGADSLALEGSYYEFWFFSVNIMYFYVASFGYADGHVVYELVASSLLCVFFYDSFEV